MRERMEATTIIYQKLCIHHLIYLGESYISTKDIFSRQSRINTMQYVAGHWVISTKINRGKNTLETDS